MTSALLVLISLLLPWGIIADLNLLDPKGEHSYYCTSLDDQLENSVQGEVQRAQPLDACSPLHHAKGKILLASLENCYIEEKVKNAKVAEALGIVIFGRDGHGSTVYISNARDEVFGITGITHI
jgi:hypothetical protein